MHKKEFKMFSMKDDKDTHFKENRWYDAETKEPLEYVQKFLIRKIISKNLLSNKLNVKGLLNDATYLTSETLRVVYRFFTNTTLNPYNSSIMVFSFK